MPELHDRLGYLLKHAQMRLLELTEPALAPLGVTGRDLAVLTVLGRAEPLAQQEAATRLGIDRTTMVELVDHLEAKGLVTRRPDPKDRRRNLVHLTDRGHTTLTDGDQAYRTAEEAFLPPGDTAQLRTLLRRALDLEPR